MSQLKCPTCDKRREPVLRWKPMASGDMHLGAYCPLCDKWIKWVPQSMEWMALAPDWPHQEAML